MTDESVQVQETAPEIESGAETEVEHPDLSPNTEEKAADHSSTEKPDLVSEESAPDVKNIPADGAIVAAANKPSLLQRAGHVEECLAVFLVELAASGVTGVDGELQVAKSFLDNAVQSLKAKLAA